MSRVRFASLRPLLAVSAILAAASVPLACAHGSSETDLGYTGVGGAGGAGTSVVTTGGFPTSSTTSSASSANTTTTGGFPSSSSTSGFPSSSSSTSGFPSSSSSTSGFPSSSSSTSGFPASSSSSSGGGSSACDSSGDCGTCVSCADSSVCFIQSLNCQFDFDCPSIMDCVSTCSDDACFQSCLDQYPASAQIFLDYYDCLGCACQLDCMVPAGSCP